ncbi:hypothetical protein EMCG_00696, partial [[Emmonsia] crescens]
LQTIAYRQETTFPLDPDPGDNTSTSTSEEIPTIEPWRLDRSLFPEAEAGVYYNSTHNLTQNDYYSFSESSLDNSSSHLAGSEIDDFLTSVDEAQPATPVQKYINSTSGQSPAHSFNKKNSEKFR